MIENTSNNQEQNDCQEGLLGQAFPHGKSDISIRNRASQDDGAALPAHLEFSRPLCIEDLLTSLHFHGEKKSPQSRPRDRRR
jgi:hypothetical protein